MPVLLSLYLKNLLLNGAFSINDLFHKKVLKGNVIYSVCFEIYLNIKIFLTKHSIPEGGTDEAHDDF